MARSHGRTDRNQLEIMRALREAGASCTSLADVGKGVPDLLVGIPTEAGGETHLVEVKDGAKVLSRQALTTAQKRFVAEWLGSPVIILVNVEQAAMWVKRRMQAQCSG